mmetsp:Transcript_8133/g.18145  ORF Transcript_8133/g.18145 Transcript_8133/m.18145 type:complete len:195 (-) Transcript_8133:71-655(-)
MSEPGLPSDLASVLGRGFRQLYRLAAGGQAGNDMLVQHHVNGLFVVCLAPSHMLLREGQPRISEFSFRSSVAGNEVSGKKKKGGAVLRANTVIADVKLDDGSKVALHAAVEGKLVETNERLADEPHLLQAEPDDAGFLLVVQPRWPEEGLKTAAALTDSAAFAAHLAKAGITPRSCGPREAPATNKRQCRREGS